MILDYNVLPFGDKERELLCGYLKIDGKFIDIRGVFYVNTDARVVRTYNVAGDGKRHTMDEVRKLFPTALQVPKNTYTTDSQHGRMLWRELRGEIELFTKDMVRIA